MASDAICPLPTVHPATREQDDRSRRSTGRTPPAFAAGCSAMTRDPAVADDLVSEAFIRLATEIRAGRTPDDPPAWLYRVGANLVVSRARRAAVATRALPGLRRPRMARVARGRGRRPRARPAAARRARHRSPPTTGRSSSWPRGAIGPRRSPAMIGKSGPATRTRLCRARGRLRSSLELAGMTA